MKNPIFVPLIILSLSVGCQSQDEKKARKLATDLVKNLSKSRAASETLQHIEVFKQPGDPTTVWFWNIPSDSFDGISLESSPTVEGTYTDMNLTIPKTAVSVTFPAPDSQTFYNPYFWQMNGGTKTRLVSSKNVVEVSIGAPPGPIPPIPVPPVEPLGPAAVITAR